MTSRTRPTLTAHDCHPSNLPFQEKTSEVSSGLEQIAIKPYQIVVWMTLGAQTGLELRSNAARFPAILDTGHNHNFSIQERHLTEWAKLDVRNLQRVNNIRDRGVRVPLFRVQAWIHPNVSGKRDEVYAPAFHLALDQGIAVHPAQSPFPRLPLLGLRALVRNRLHLNIDPERCLVNLRTPDWRTKLLRFLG